LEDSTAETGNRPTDHRGIHVFSVSVNDTDAVGSVIDSASNVGAEIGNVELTRTEETRDELRDEATEA